MKTVLAAAVVVLGAMTADAALAEAPNARWAFEFPKTEWSIKSIDFDEILSGGPPRDGIPPIDVPAFEKASEIEDIAETEPVIGLIKNGEAKAYPLRVLMWHEIVNDAIGGVPVAVTYCPLCNSSIVFDRRVDGQVLSFGTTGKLRNSDLVMYDRQTETWWQQFLGEGIVGEMTGVKLKTIPARLESFANFKKRAPDGRVLVPNGRHFRDYGRNPYVLYDDQNAPYDLFSGNLPTYIEPMARVVVVNEEAWSLSLIRDKGTLTDGGVTISWTAGQNSAVNTAEIAAGRDVGNVVAQVDGEDVVYDVTFAFVFNAFFPEKRVRIE